MFETKSHGIMSVMRSVLPGKNFTMPRPEYTNKFPVALNVSTL